VFRHAGKDYILYHRHSIPFDPQFVGRQVCVDELKFTADGRIEQVVPTHAGPALVRGRKTGLPATASASSGEARYAVDDNYATRWEANGGWLQLDLGASKRITRQEIRFEYAWKPYRFAVQVSDDGRQWRTLADHTREAVTGSPVVLETSGAARYLRLIFSVNAESPTPSVLEWIVE
jgi:hypothetical protein